MVGRLQSTHRRMLWRFPSILGPFRMCLLSCPLILCLRRSRILRACRSVPIHILRIDTGQPHPLASISALQHDVRDNFTEIYPPYMSISQSTVAVLFRESGQAEQVIDEDRLFVWNWRTGSKILVGFSLPRYPIPTELLTHLCSSR